MLVDLHAHSTASDGTDTPAEVVRLAGDAGLDVVALTDHDTTAGWAQAEAALPPGLTLVPGAELSCRWHDGERGVNLHMLAYLFDSSEPALAAEMSRVCRSREDRAQRMIERLQADGLTVPWEDVTSAAAGGTVGRPHIAQVLVRHNERVGSVQEAFGSDWLGQGSRYHVPKQDMDVFDALSLVQAAGGVAVLAHPRRRDRRVPDECIAQLARHGLFGIEVDHPEHGLAERKRVRTQADQLGLMATGSSDFHGERKPSKLGANTTDARVYECMTSTATGCAPITAAVDRLRP